MSKESELKLNKEELDYFSLIIRMDINWAKRAKELKFLMKLAAKLELTN